MPQTVAVTSRPAWWRAAARIAGAEWFARVIILVILANAVVIGLGTFSSGEQIDSRALVIDHIFLGVFVVELIIRMAAVGFRPVTFLRDGWNAFDFLVVAIAFIPGVSSSATALRIVRLLRVSRLMRVMPDIKVLIRGLRRAAGPALSLAALTLLLCYLYAIVGWMLFGGKTPEGMPGYFNNIGAAMLTLFELLTLEGWNSVLHDLRQVSDLAIPFVISFVLIGTYVVVNLVVGIVITSLDEAYRERDREQQRRELDETEHEETVEETVTELRELIARLEVQLEQRGTHRS